jgi:hypothetical protein
VNSSSTSNAIYSTYRKHALTMNRKNHWNQVYLTKAPEKDIGTGTGGHGDFFQSFSKFQCKNNLPASAQASTASHGGSLANIKPVKANPAMTNRLGSVRADVQIGE